MADLRETSFIFCALASAYAENGQFQKAIEHQRRAIDWAREIGEEELMREMNQRLKLYKVEKPYRR